MTADGLLGDRVSRARVLMLDFDGPVCDVFAGLSAPEVAGQVRAALRRLGVPMPADLERDDDPLSIYRSSTGRGAAVVAAVHDVLIAAELRAVTTAAATPGAAAVIAAARANGQRLAVVSNNAASAVSVYLERHGLLDQIDHIAARRTREPALLKPNPHFLFEAAAALREPTRACVLVGDSVTDIEAAKQAGVSAVGYANKPGKAERLAAAGADVVIDSMTTLAEALRFSPR